MNAPLFMGFPRQEYQSGVPFPSPWNETFNNDLKEQQTLITEEWWKSFGTLDCMYYGENETPQSGAPPVVYVGPASSHRGPVTCAPPDLGLDVRAQKSVEWVCLTWRWLQTQEALSCLSADKGNDLRGDTACRLWQRCCWSPEVPLHPPWSVGSHRKTAQPHRLPGLCALAGVRGWVATEFSGPSGGPHLSSSVDGAITGGKTLLPQVRGYHTTLSSDKRPQCLRSEPPVLGCVYPDVCPPWWTQGSYTCPFFPP